MIYIKIHKSNNQEILAVCDKELIGKIFKDKDICLKDWGFDLLRLPEEEIRSGKFRERLVKLIG